jgi:hypothetical protein
VVNASRFTSANHALNLGVDCNNVEATVLSGGAAAAVRGLAVPAAAKQA